MSVMAIERKRDKCKDPFAFHSLIYSIIRIPKRIQYWLKESHSYGVSRGHTMCLTYSTSSTFLACGAVTLIPLSNLNKFISNSLQTHQVLTVLIAFLISRPFISHFANSCMSFFETLGLAASWGRRDRNFCQRRRREENGRGVKRRWILTRERKAVSMVE